MSRVYSVKEAYVTLQGEGAQTGRAAVFLRFAGCNLWNGLESGRASAVCQFCDTDFVGTDGENGGKFETPEDLAAHVRQIWQASGVSQTPEDGCGKRYVICTGGEPLLQLDGPLIGALKGEGFEIGVETNGTQPVPDGIDWVCVSPKANAPLVVSGGDELKLVYPQTEPEAQPERFVHLDFQHFFLQPMDSPEQGANQQAARFQMANIEAAAQYCMKHPQWRLSLQTHKLIGLP